MHDSLPDVDHWTAGDTHTDRVTVYDPDTGDPLTLLGGNVEFWLTRLTETDPVLTASDTGVTAAITDPDNGVVEAELASGATEHLEGTFERHIRVNDGSGNRRTYTGEIEFEPIPESV